MDLDAVLKKISKNPNMAIKKREDGIDVYIRENPNGKLSRIIRIYPKYDSAEFLDIEDVWTELSDAVEEEYPNFPEISELVNSLNEADYNIVW